MINQIQTSAAIVIALNVLSDSTTPDTPMLSDEKLDHFAGLYNQYLVNELGVNFIYFCKYCAFVLPALQDPRTRAKLGQQLQPANPSNNFGWDSVEVEAAA